MWISIILGLLVLVAIVLAHMVVAFISASYEPIHLLKQRRKDSLQSCYKDFDELFELGYGFNQIALELRKNGHSPKDIAIVMEDMKNQSNKN